MSRTHSYHFQGFALITVLWMSAFLAVIAGLVSYQSRVSLKLADNTVDSFKSRHAAEGALLLTANKLIKRDEIEGLVLANSIMNYEIDDAFVRVHISDESGKVDVNLAPTDLLRSLFIVLGENERTSAALADAIADWRDQDQLKRASGAEDQHYAAQRKGYEAKDDEFDSIDEVRLVLGMNPKIYNKIKPYITVYSQDLGVNPALASLPVKNALQNVTGGTSEEIASDYVTSTGGLIYTLNAQATDPSGANANIEAIIRLQRGNVFEPFTILGWKQS